MCSHSGFAVPGFEVWFAPRRGYWALYCRGQPARRRSGLIAEQIIQKAKESGVFVHESRELVSLLMNVDLDQQIPPGLYQAIAELLAWVYQIENKEFSTEGKS